MYLLKIIVYSFEHLQGIWLKGIELQWESNLMPLTFKVSALTTRPWRLTVQSYVDHLSKWFNATAPTAIYI